MGTLWYKSSVSLLLVEGDEYHEKAHIVRDDSAAEELVSQTQKICREFSRKSITLVRDRNDFLPLDQEKIKNVTVICSSHKDSFFKNLEVVKNELESRGASVKMRINPIVVMQGK